MNLWLYEDVFVYPRGLGGPATPTLLSSLHPRWKIGLVCTFLLDYLLLSSIALTAYFPSIGASHTTPDSINLCRPVTAASLGYRNQTLIEQKSFFIITINTLTAPHGTACWFLCPPSDILPSRSEPSTCACKETFLLILLKVLVKLIRIQLWRSEQGKNVYDEVHG